MAHLGQTFDPHAVPEDEKSFDPIPPGNYLLQATDSDVVPTKTGNGTRLTVTLQVMDGPFQGRLIFEGLNIYHQNAEAQRIGQRQLADLCLAVGIGSLNDSAELIGRPFTARVGIQEDKTGQYQPRNVIKRWHIQPTKLERAQAAQPAAAARPAPAQSGTVPRSAPAQTPTRPAPTQTARPAAQAGARPWATR